MAAPTCGCQSVPQPIGGTEDDDSATFVAVAALVVAAGKPERRRGRGDNLDMLVQGGLVALDLDNKVDAGRGCSLKCFFGSAGRRA